LLVPALCRELRVATAELARSNAELARRGAEALADETFARRHEELSLALQRAGYCLGVLGAGARADLLRGRRERRGLRWMAEELATAAGLAFEPGCERLPTLSHTGERGWNAVLLAAWSFQRAARRSSVLSWRVERGVELVVALHGPVSGELARRCLELSAATGVHLRPRAAALGLALS
jgi:hypothetical protein